MNNNNWQSVNKLIQYPEKGILSQVIFKSQKLEATLFCLARGTEISDHAATREALILVYEGRGEFILAGEKIEMAAGTMIHFPPNAVHSLKARENTAFLLFLVN